jgi:hypothetical protein
MMVNRRGLATLLATLSVATVLVTQLTSGPSAAGPNPVLSPALADVTGAAGDPIAISCACTDDGEPDPPAAIAYLWTQAAGPGTCTFLDDTDPTTTATCDTAGAPTITCTCCDDVFSGETCTGNSDNDTLTATLTNPFFLIDNMGGDPPSFVYWINGRVDSDYTGALFNVRRSAGSPSTSDIGYDVGTNLYDSATLSTFCAGVNCFVVTVYDQSGNGLNATQATTTAQPKIWDSVTGAITCTTASGTELCMLQDTTDSLATANQGFNGAPAVTIAITVDDDRAAPPASNTGFASVGANTAGSLGLWANSTTQHYGFVSTTTSTRWARLNGLLSNSTFILSIPAGGTRSTQSLRTNGVLLNEDFIASSSGDDVTTLSLSPTGSTTWGRAAGSITGRLSFFGAWDEELSGARLEALNTWLLDRTPIDRALIVAGQSNAAGLGTADFVGDDEMPASMSFANISFSGTCLSQWQPHETWTPGPTLAADLDAYIEAAAAEEDVLYERLLAHIIAQPAGRKPVIWWWQGECDSGTELEATAYEAAFMSFWSDLVSDSSRTLYLIDTLIYDGAYPAVATMNAVKTDNCTDLGPSICTILDPNSYPPPAGTTDGVHANTDLKNAIRPDAYAAAEAF